MNVTLRGGPLDGREMLIEDSRREWSFPQPAEPLNLNALIAQDPMERIPLRVYVYRRDLHWDEGVRELVFAREEQR